MRAPEVQRDVAYVHAQRGDAHAAVKAARAAADSVRSGAQERGAQVVHADIRDERHGRHAPQLARMQRLDPERLGARAHVRPRIGQADAAGAEGARDQRREKRRAGAEGQALTGGCQHQHLAVGIALQQRGQVRRDVAVCVAEVVGHARRRHRIHPGRQRHEHRVGERHAQLLGKRASPRAADQPHAVHRHRRYARAASRPALAARRAGAAADLEGHHDAVAPCHALHALADGEHLGDTFVSQVKGQRELSRAERDHAVDVARGGRDRSHHRRVRRRRTRDRHLLPAQAPTGRGTQGAHALARGPAPLPCARRARARRLPEPLARVAPQHLAHALPRVRPQQAGVVAQPAARAMPAGCAHSRASASSRGSARRARVSRGWQRAPSGRTWGRARSGRSS